MRLIDELRQFNLPTIYRAGTLALMREIKTREMLNQAFGLKHHNIYSASIADDSLNQTVRLDYLWYAKITSWWESNVILSTLKCIPYDTQIPILKQVLLVTKAGAEFEYLGDRPYRSVSLPNQKDDLAEAIRGLNFFEPLCDVIPDQSPSPQITLMISSPNGTREIHYNGGYMTDGSWVKLRNTLFAMIRTVSEAYQDEAMDAYFAKGIPIQSGGATFYVPQDMAINAIDDLAKDNLPRK